MNAKIAPWHHLWGQQLPLPSTKGLVLIHPIVPHRLGAKIKCSLNTHSSLHSMRRLLRTKPWWSSTPKWTIPQECGGWSEH